MTPWLRDQLLTYKASLGEVAPDDPVFPTRNETFRDKDNINHRVIAPVERTAGTLRAERGHASSLPTGLSAHVFRRTYITLMAEAGAPITSHVQDQVGHESARLTLEIYARVSRSRDRAKMGTSIRRDHGRRGTAKGIRNSRASRAVRGRRSDGDRFDQLWPCLRDRRRRVMRRGRGGPEIQRCGSVYSVRAPFGITMTGFDQRHERSAPQSGAETERWDPDDRRRGPHFPLPCV